MKVFTGTKMKVFLSGVEVPTHADDAVRYSYASLGPSKIALLKVLRKLGVKSADSRWLVYPAQ